ncbi:hypothetical protein EVAR_81413_1 [Eumeta japonica]|uniref:Uncharacterized protein n=1 Tax=Eumeta variegata TaxID=151549 RepID=A0A4C1WFC8_EUMVA|nr:hypothetical protein EVAR_81413_1 [Eumeta japonica]
MKGECDDEEGVVHRNSHSVDAIQQREPLLLVCRFTRGTVLGQLKPMVTITRSSVLLAKVPRCCESDGVSHSVLYHTGQLVIDQFPPAAPPAWTPNEIRHLLYRPITLSTTIPMLFSLLNPTLVLL